MVATTRNTAMDDNMKQFLAEAIGEIRAEMRRSIAEVHSPMVATTRNTAMDDNMKQFLAEAIGEIRAEMRRSIAEVNDEVNAINLLQNHLAGEVRRNNGVEGSNARANQQQYGRISKSTQEQEEALYDSQGEIVRTGIYEVDCTNMETWNQPRVGQISEITHLGVRLRFPGFQSARNFLNSEIRMGRKYPTLDDYCDINKDMVSTVLIRRVEMEEYGERKHMLNFWFAKLNIRPQPLFSKKYDDQLISGTVPITIGMRKKHSMEGNKKGSSSSSSMIADHFEAMEIKEEALEDEGPGKTEDSSSSKGKGQIFYGLRKRSRK